MAVTFTKKKVLFVMMIVAIMISMMTGCSKSDGTTQLGSRNKYSGKSLGNEIYSLRTTSTTYNGDSSEKDHIEVWKDNEISSYIDGYEVDSNDSISLIEAKVMNRTIYCLYYATDESGQFHQYGLLSYTDKNAQEDNYEDDYELKVIYQDKASEFHNYQNLTICGENAYFIESIEDEDTGECEIKLMQTNLNDYKTDTILSQRCSYEQSRAILDGVILSNVLYYLNIDNHELLSINLRDEFKKEVIGTFPDMYYEGLIGIDGDSIYYSELKDGLSYLHIYYRSTGEDVTSEYGYELYEVNAYKGTIYFKGIKSEDEKSAIFTFDIDDVSENTLYEYIETNDGYYYDTTGLDICNGKLYTEVSVFYEDSNYRFKIQSKMAELPTSGYSTFSDKITKEYDELKAPIEEKLEELYPGRNTENTNAASNTNEINSESEFSKSIFSGFSLFHRSLKGSWERVDNSNSWLQFNIDGTGTMNYDTISYDCTWQVSGNRYVLICQDWNLKYTGEYRFENGQLVLTVDGEKGEARYNKRK